VIRKISHITLTAFLVFGVICGNVSAQDPCLVKCCCKVSGMEHMPTGDMLSNVSSHACCAGPDSSPCSLNDSTAPSAFDFTLASTQSDNHRCHSHTTPISHSAVYFDPDRLIDSKTSGQTGNFFQTIPIYLQALSLLC
jgi:hypothetical protein